ncbi:WAT1-related protein At1g68170 isoform X2 [Medicago truncatula]|nr:WAT1-related protein At1g68170 isoform X2 [Medicago truncatula]
MANLVPAVTFIMVVSLGMEKLNLRTKAGKAKIVGTIIGIGGAMILTFIKGVEIKMGSFHLNLLHHQNDVGSHSHATTISTGNTILGSLYAMVSAISYALWLIIQAKMNERYPTHYSSTTLMSFWASLLSTMFALCFDRDLSQWRLGWNIRLLIVAYAGIVASGAMVVVISWCVHMRGPLFASAFNPLVLVIVALASCTMLNENLYLGSIIGSVLIVCGLYAVVWGKSKEMKKNNQLVPSQSSNEFDTVEIVVRHVVDDKRNHNSNNGLSNTSQEVKDNQDSLEAVQHEKQSEYLQNQEV